MAAAGVSSSSGLLLRDHDADPLSTVIFREPVGYSSTAARGTATDPDQIALELSALLTGADVAFLLHEDPRILHGVRAAIERRLGG